MESMSVLERLSELLPALPPGLIEAWGQLVLFAVPVCLYLAAVVLPFVVLYGLMESYTAGSPRHSYHSELCCGYAMVMGAALCGYAVSLILHIALWQLFASMIILVCRFMVVVVVIGAKKEA